MATWQRFTRDDEDLIEATIDGSTIHVRRVDAAAEPSVEFKLMANPSTAQRGLERRIAQWRAAGFAPAGLVDRPLPAPEHKETLAERHARGMALFRERLPSFVSGWHALGFAVDVSFAKACVGNRHRPGEVAAQCLTLARRVFEVDFAARTRSFDAEHGHSSRVTPSVSASFYESPARVCALALRKLQGHARSTDDFEDYGLVDEVLALLRGDAPSRDSD